VKAENGCAAIFWYFMFLHAIMNYNEKNVRTLVGDSTSEPFAKLSGINGIESIACWLLGSNAL
jgi:hypothetical protein